MTREEEIRQIETVSRTRKDELIANRTTWANSVRAWAEDLKKVDPAKIEHIGVPLEDITPEKLIPALFTEPYDHEAFLVQKAKTQELFDQFTKVQDELITRAKRELGLA